MPTKKVVRKASKARPDMKSKKRSGYVANSVRVTVAEAKLIREAAYEKGLSTNFWMTQTLLAEAKKVLAAAAKAKVAAEKQ